MSKQNTNFDSTEKEEKFSTGPTPAIPGPVLFSVVKTELNVVAKSKLFNDTIRIDTTIIKK